MKRVSVFMVLVAISSGTTAGQQTERPAPNARAAVEGYVAAALAGQTGDATALAVEGQSPSRKERIEEFKAILGVKALKVATVYASDRQGEAVAVSEIVKLTQGNPDGRDGVLSFKLIQVKGKWLLKDIDFDTSEKAKGKVEEFRKVNPDAKELAAESK